MLHCVLDLIYPPTCGICGKIHPNFLCESCLKQINKIAENKIRVTEKSTLYYHQHFYIFRYQGVIREKMIDYKFHDASYLSHTFEKILVNNKKLCDFIKCYDIIIPVPLHPKRKKERGYNQSTFMIQGFLQWINLNQQTHLRLEENLLKKVYNTPKQSSLNLQEREKNVIGAYEMNQNCYHQIANKSLLIFDDIYTTGNTVNECARILRLGNPKTIDVFTFAKD